MRNLRVKIFMQLLSLVGGVFLVMGFILNYSLEVHFQKAVTNQLENAANGVVKSIASTSNQELNEAIIRESYNLIVDFYGKTTGANIIVFDTNGAISVCSANAKKYANNKLPENVVGEIISGKNIYDRTRFNSFFGYKAIVVGKPIVTDNITIGGVVAAMPIPRLSELKWEIIKMILWAMLFSMAIAIGLGYIITRQISAPIKKIDEAVMAISRGEFDKRLNLDNSREMITLSENFNEMASSLENLDLTSKNFIANVSHELRTPMTIITGFLQGISDGTVPQEKQGEYIRLVINETKRLTRLVNELLDVAKMENKNEKLKIDKFDINELLRLGIIKFENRILEKNINVKMLLADNATYVSADHDGIERVITNLIDNAVKFTETGGYICLKTKVSGDTVYVSIENSGTGIEPGDIEYIWQRFHKSDKSRSMDKTGAGLGLYIVKSIINRHNQTITVTSEVNKFTCFTFTLKVLK